MPSTRPRARPVVAPPRARSADKKTPAAAARPDNKASKAAKAAPSKAAKSTPSKAAKAPPKAKAPVLKTPLKPILKWPGTPKTGARKTVRKGSTAQKGPTTAAKKRGRSGSDSSEASVRFHPRVLVQGISNVGDYGPFQEDNDAPVEDASTPGRRVDQRRQEQLIRRSFTKRTEKMSREQRIFGPGAPRAAVEVALNDATRGPLNKPLASKTKEAWPKRDVAAPPARKQYGKSVVAASASANGKLGSAANVELDNNSTTTTSGDSSSSSLDSGLGEHALAGAMAAAYKAPSRVRKPPRPPQFQEHHTKNCGPGDGVYSRFHNPHAIFLGKPGSWAAAKPKVALDPADPKTWAPKFSGQTRTGRYGPRLKETREKHAVKSPRACDFRNDCNPQNFVLRFVWYKPTGFSGLVWNPAVLSEGSDSHVEDQYGRDGEESNAATVKRSSASSKCGGRQLPKKLPPTWWLVNAGRETTDPKLPNCLEFSGHIRHLAEAERLIKAVMEEQLRTQGMVEAYAITSSLTVPPCSQTVSRNSGANGSASTAKVQSTSRPTKDVQKSAKMSMKKATASREPPPMKKAADKKKASTATKSSSTVQPMKKKGRK